MPAISDKMLLDDVIYEVDWDGDIVWEWKVSDHFEELGFDAIARNLMYRDPNYYTGFGNSHIAGDWVHTNSMSVLGPNKWYDAGDKRFHPDNIIIDCPRRQHHPDHRKSHRRHRMEDRPVFRSDPPNCASSAGSSASITPT